jgi:hypothetical protein
MSSGSYNCFEELVGKGFHCQEFVDCLDYALSAVSDCWLGKAKNKDV